MSSVSLLNRRVLSLNPVGVHSQVISLPGITVVFAGLLHNVIDIIIDAYDTVKMITVI